MVGAAAVRAGGPLSLPATARPGGTLLSHPDMGDTPDVELSYVNHRCAVLSQSTRISCKQQALHGGKAVIQQSTGPLHHVARIARPRDTMQFGTATASFKQPHNSS